jgi:hypothetical protein
MLLGTGPHKLLLSKTTTQLRVAMLLQCDGMLPPRPAGMGALLVGGCKCGCTACWGVQVWMHCLLGGAAPREIGA